MARPSQYEDHRDTILMLLRRASIDASMDPPTIRSLAKHVGVSGSTMQNYLYRLTEEGRVRHRPKKHTAWRYKVPHEHEQVAADYMSRKGLTNVWPTRVIKVEGQDCWYFYYTIDGGTLELEVSHDGQEWDTQTDFRAG